MNPDLQAVRDTLIEHIHDLADEQDENARSAMRRSDLQRETAHRGAAIGLRMAAGLVSANLSQDPSGGARGWRPDSDASPFPCIGARWCDDMLV